MTFAKLGAFQLTVKTVNAFLFFYFPSCPLSLVYMQVPSSQERASNNFERTLLEKAYWMYSKHQDFRRRLWRLFDWKGKAIKYVMLEYSFKGEERTIHPLPHRSSKNDKPFLRTEKSTKDRVKSLVKDGKRDQRSMIKFLKKKVA